jgi:hypothetical protein
MQTRHMHPQVAQMVNDALRWSSTITSELTTDWMQRLQMPVLCSRYAPDFVEETLAAAGVGVSFPCAHVHNTTIVVVL